MKGNSGATLKYKGEYIRKFTSDYFNQELWFNLAKKLPLTDGIIIPHTKLPNKISNCSYYDIEFIQGICATQSRSTLTISTLIDQILIWKKYSAHRYDLSWNDYLLRLYNEHVSIREDDNVMNEAFNFVSKIENIPPSFSHGDLTLENVIIDKDKNLYIIDPNFKPNLFQSYILDFGKLLQSTHYNYHQVFNSNPGVDLKPHFLVLLDKLDNLGILKECLIAEITHFMRLKKYQTQSKWALVDDLILKLIKEV